MSLCMSMLNATVSIMAIYKALVMAMQSIIPAPLARLICSLDCPYNSTNHYSSRTCSFITRRCSESHNSVNTKFLHSDFTIILRMHNRTHTTALLTTGLPVCWLNDACIIKVVKIYISISTNSAAILQCMDNADAIYQLVNLSK